MREKETQFQSLSKTVQELHRELVQLNGSGAISNNSLIAKNIDLLGNLVASTFTVHIGEPTRVLGDFVGSGNDFNRLLSFLRERDSEITLLRTRLIDTEKRITHNEFSGVDSERTISSLRRENADLTRQIDTLRSQGSTSSVTGSNNNSQVR